MIYPILILVKALLAAAPFALLCYQDNNTFPRFQETEHLVLYQGNLSLCQCANYAYQHMFDFSFEFMSDTTPSLMHPTLEKLAENGIATCTFSPNSKKKKKEKAFSLLIIVFLFFFALTPNLFDSNAPFQVSSLSFKPLK